MSPRLSQRVWTLALLFLLSTAPALAEDWVISKISGEAWITDSNAPAVAATSGMTIPDGATFSTGRNARAKLERGAETILVSPNSVITPRQSSFSGTTTILHQVGRIELDVEKRNVKHFAVETPFLAAVVKGTHFTVTVSSRAAEVQVERGLVEVSALTSGEVTDVAPGQKASVSISTSKGLQVGGKGKLPEVRRGPVRSPQVESITPQPAKDRPLINYGNKNGSVDKDGTENGGGKGAGAGGSANGSNAGGHGGGSGKGTKGNEGPASSGGGGKTNKGGSGDGGNDGSGKGSSSNNDGGSANNGGPSNSGGNGGNAGGSGSGSGGGSIGGGSGGAGNGNSGNGGSNVGGSGGGNGNAGGNGGNNGNAGGSGGNGNAGGNGGGPGAGGSGGSNGGGSNKGGGGNAGGKGNGRNR